MQRQKENKIFMGRLSPQKSPVAQQIHWCQVCSDYLYFKMTQHSHRSQAVIHMNVMKVMGVAVYVCNREYIQIRKAQIY